jgi:hypothetical protein
MAVDIIKRSTHIYIYYCKLIRDLGFLRLSLADLILELCNINERPWLDSSSEIKLRCINYTRTIILGDRFFLPRIVRLRRRYNKIIYTFVYELEVIYTTFCI